MPVSFKSSLEPGCLPLSFSRNSIIAEVQEFSTQVMVSGWEHIEKSVRPQGFCMGFQQLALHREPLQALRV